MSGPAIIKLREGSHGEALRAELEDARRETDLLFDLFSPEALYARPIPERHRLIFYLGHFEAFDWNVLARRGLNAPSFYPEFDRLFERGIDPAPGQAASDTAGDWPARSEVERYNLRTREWIDSHWTDFDPWLRQMVIEHRMMHAETMAYLIHALPYEQKQHGPVTISRRGAPANPLVDIKGAIVTMGKNPDTFGWDNEHRAHDVAVPAFRISKFKISNGEYLRFVNEGGSVPHFWILRDGTWYWRGMFAEIPLPLDWPVWTTWNQASAYAQWRGLKLPSEAEYQAAASLLAPDPRKDNFDFARWDPIAVDSGNRLEDVPVQMTGNGWEWTRDIFAPFPGFEVHPLYPGYSADFFDNEHYIMKGASPRTASLLTRPSFRNWFRPDYPYMFAGFRLVESEAN